MEILKIELRKPYFIMSDKCNIKWRDFQPHVANTISSLIKDKNFVDVTLMSNNYHQISAHRVVLSSCSEYFKNVLSNSNNQSHLVLCLDGVTKEELEDIVTYMYHGEVNINQNDLEKFLELAQKFVLHGLLNSETAVYAKEDEITTYSKDESNDTEKWYEDIFLRQKSLIMNEDIVNNTDSDISLNDTVHQDEKKSFMKSKDSEDIKDIDRKIMRVYRENNIKAFNCNICHYQNGQKEVVKNHVLSQHMSESFYCQYCDHKCSSRNALRVHTFRKHKT